MEMAMWSPMEQGKKAFQLLKGQYLWKQMLACPTRHKEQFCGQPGEFVLLDFYRIINYML